jgi:hypothetical protein
MGIITNQISGSASGGSNIAFTGSLHIAGNEVISAAGAIKRMDAAAADNSTLEVNGTAVRVKAQGISDSHIHNSAAIAITKLAASTISGKSLGANLDNHSAGNGLSGTDYNGAGAQSWAVQPDGGTLTVGAGGVKVSDLGIADAQISGGAAIAISKLAARSISGKDLGTNLDFIQAGNGLSGSNYNGGAAQTWSVIGGDGLAVSADGLSVDLATNPGLLFSSNKLDVKVKSESGGSITKDANGLYIADAAIGNDKLAGSIANAKLANSTISGKALGANLDALTHGAGISNLSYNGSSAVQIAVDQGWVRGSVSITDAGGDGSLAYNSGTGVITYTGPSAAEVRAHVSAGTGVAVTDGEFSIGQPVATSNSVTFQTGSFQGDVIVTGDLTVNGTTTTLAVNDLQVEDRLIRIGNGLADIAAGVTAAAGWEIGNNLASFKLNTDIDGAGLDGFKCSLPVSASAFVGDGSKLTGIDGGAVSSVAGALTNQTDNRVMTSLGGGRMNGEANLTFDGTLLTCNGNLTIGDLMDSHTLLVQAALDLRKDTEVANGKQITPAADAVSGNNLGASNKRWSRVYAQEVHAGDLCMKNDRGAWRLIEEDSFLSLRNEKTGKRYKFNMTLLPEDQWDPDGNWEA